MKAIGTIFFGEGLLFFLVGLWLTIISVINLNNSDKVTAVIKEIKTEQQGKTVIYSPYVKYIYEDEEYYTYLNEYSSDMYIGQEVDICVNPENPSKAVIPTMYLYLGIPFMFLGLIPLGLVLNLIMADYKEKKEKRKIAKTGKVVLVTILDEHKDKSTEEKGEYQIYYTCIDTNGKKYKTESVYLDKKYNIGQVLATFVDKEDKKKYYVDVFKEYTYRLTDLEKKEVLDEG